MSACNINIMSLNVRGLRNYNKRMALLQALKENKVDISLLQETYLTNDMVSEIEKCYGDMYYCIHSYGTNHSRGVSFLFRKECKIIVVSRKIDSEGRMIVLNVEINDQPYSIVNVYAPNSERERKGFFEKLKNWISLHVEFKDKCIVAGDFNIVPNPAMDRKGGGINVDQSRKSFEYICSNYNLLDAWRVKK